MIDLRPVTKLLPTSFSHLRPPKTVDCNQNWNRKILTDHAVVIRDQINPNGILWIRFDVILTIALNTHTETLTQRVLILAHHFVWIRKDIARTSCWNQRDHSVTEHFNAQKNNYKLIFMRHSRVSRMHLSVRKHVVLLCGVCLCFMGHWLGCNLELGQRKKTN